MADTPKQPDDAMAPVELPLVYRSLALEVDRAAMATRAEGDDRIPLVISSEYRALQPDAAGRPYWETLDHSSEAVDTERFARGLPLMAVTDGFEHENGKQVGVVEEPTLGADRKLRGMARFSRSAFAQEIKQDVLDGIRSGVSPGYRVYRMTREPAEGGVPSYRVTRWQPYEVSLVPSPADPTVGVGRRASTTAFPVEVEGAVSAPVVEDATPAPVNQPESIPEVAPAVRALTVSPAPVAEEQQMSEITADGAAPAHKPGTVAVSLEDQRRAIADISRIAAAHDMTDQVPAWVERGLSVEQVKAEIFDAKIKHATRTTAPGYLDLSEKDAQQFSYTRAITNILTKKWVDDGGFEKEVSDAVAKRSNRQTGGFFIPLDLKVRAAATGNITSTSSLGGAGVQTTLLSLIDLLRNKMLVRQLGATVLSGLQGNISFPRQIVPNTMAWEGENPSTAHAATAATLDNVTLSPKTAMASSAYSRQLLIQSSFDVSSFIQNDLATVLALGLDLAALDGTGSANQPTGVMRQTGVTTITHGTTDGAAPDWASMVSYETNVAANNADIGTMAWVTSPAMRGKLKTVLKSTTAGSTYIWEQDQTINGYGAYASQQMPNNYTRGTSTTVASGIVFGVWSELLIGEWGGALEVIVDPYTLASQNMVAVTQMILADIAVRHPKAFAQSKSALSA